VKKGGRPKLERCCRGDAGKKTRQNDASWAQACRTDRNNQRDAEPAGDRAAPGELIMEDSGLGKKAHMVHIPEMGACVRRAAGRKAIIQGPKKMGFRCQRAKGEGAMATSSMRKNSVVSAVRVDLQGGEEKAKSGLE